VNAIVLVFPSERLAEIRSFVALARRQSRLSVQKRQWAAEAALHGKIDLSDKWGAEASRLRAEAAWSIQYAQRIKDRRHA